jgi:hypothetical protein
MNYVVFNYMFGMVMVAVLCGYMFWVGKMWQKWSIKRQQDKCQHEFRLFRVCPKCELKQKGVVLEGKNEARE